MSSPKNGHSRHLQSDAAALELVDNGWIALEEGDVRAAEKLAKSAMAQAPKSPEPLLLLGAIRATSDDLDGAEQLLEKARKLAPDDAAPVVQLAHVYVAMGRIEDGLPLFAKAVTLAKDDEERRDLLLHHVQALVDLGDHDDEARAELAKVPAGPFEDPEDHLWTADLAVALDDHATALRHLNAVLAADPDSADARYGLGLVYEAAGEDDKKVEAWLLTRKLDLAEPPFPWALPQAEFERIAEEALASLPPEMHRRLENVPILSADYPDEALIKEGWDPRILGFFSGLPLAEQAGASGNLEQILLFKRNIERIADDADEVEEQIRITLIHEAGHFFGLDDDELEAMGLG